MQLAAWRSDSALVRCLQLALLISAVTARNLDDNRGHHQRRIATASQTYAIRPLPCSNSKGENGTCMFNFKCYQKKGLVINTCIDRFMFGACCKLDPNQSAVAQAVADTATTAKPLPDPSGLVTWSSVTSSGLANKTPVTTPKPTTKATTPKTKRPKTKKPKPPTTKKPTTKKPTTTTTTTTKKPTTIKRTTPTTTTTTTTTTKKPTKKWDYKKHCGVIPLASARSVLQRSLPSSDRRLTSSERRRQGIRIVGGEPAYFGAWPWQVMVKEATFLGLFTKNKCGGVLLNSKYVLTAAHCQPGFLATLIAVFGENDLSASYEPKASFQRNIRRILVHKGFNAQSFNNDLALLELEKPVTFDEHVVPICLPAKNEVFEGRMATVTGWGRTSYGGDVPSKLMEVGVRIITNQQCQAWFDESGRSKTIKEGFLCAGFKDGVRDSCEGDSGGPLVAPRADGRWELAGTVSHGIECASPNLPGIYMRMPYYRDWIDQHINS